MKTFPKEDVYRLVEDYALIVIHAVRPADAMKEKPLLQGALDLLLREIKIRPECPSLYFQAYKLYKLMRNGEKEAEYEKLHALKKKEYEGKARFDSRGRPRCR